MPEASNNESPATFCQPHHELIERICSSPGLRNSRRLCELFRFLCGWSLDRPGAPLTEGQIGIAVFGRAPGFDSGADPIVRVQMSALRKKLGSYFRAEGAGESTVIELPKRSYVPVFRARESLRAAAGDSPPNGGTRWKRACLVLAGVLVVLGIGCGWLLQENLRLRPALPSEFGETPLRDQLWLTMFHNGLPTQVVVSDAASMILADEFTHLPSLFEYRSRDYPRQRIEQDVHEPAARDVLHRIAPAFLTTLQDTRIVTQFSRIMGPLGLEMSTIHARDFRVLPEAGSNLIVVGHRKANPWAEAFEQNLNFRYAWAAGTPARVRIVNAAPRAGEQAEYVFTAGSQGYSVVAWVPQPASAGAVLLLGGTDMASVEAGSNLVTAEQRIGGLFRRLGIRPGGQFPYFEVLLRTQVVGRGVYTSYEIVATRIIRADRR